MAWQCKDGKNTWKLFKEWALFMPLIIVSSPVNTLLWLLPRQPSCSKCTMSATVDGLCFYGDTNLPKSTFNSEPSCLVFHSKGTEGSNYKRLWIGQAWKQDRLSHDEKEDFFFFFIMLSSLVWIATHFFQVFFTLHICWTCFCSLCPSLLFHKPSVLFYIIFKCNENRQCEASSGQHF